MCHSTGYQFLRSLGFPFPSESSILERLALIQFKPGILEDNLRLLKLYIDTLPDAAIKYYAGDIILTLDTDASYLSEPGGKSRAHLEVI